MALNAGTAYITVRPDMRGFGSGVAKGVGKVGTQAGTSIGGRMAGAAGTALKRGLQVGAAGAAALAGTALVKGFGRLKALEDAEAKLSGLGHSAESVDAIMKNALESVKGTAFGMDEAASTAAGAVAAGIKPGKDLERTLKLVGDAATIGGSSMGEMGAIFNKVATSNKVQGEVIAQLSDRGIPVVQLLADELGVSGEQVMELSRKGKIGFKDFRNAMESGMGGAAQKSGETLSGAFKNTQAALGRIGANLLSGVYPMVQKFFTGAIGFLSGFEDKAAVVGERIGGLLSVGLEKIGPLLSGLFSGGGGVSTFMSVFAQVADVLRTVLAGLWPTIEKIGRDLIAVLGPALQTIGAKINDDLLPAFRGILPIIMPVAKFILKMLGSALVGIVKGAVKVITGAIDVITGIFKMLKAVVTGDWQGMWDALKQILGGAFQAILGAVEVWFNAGILAIFKRGVLGLLKGWKAGWAKMKGLLTGAQKAMNKAISAIGRVLLGLLKKARPTFNGISKVVGFAVKKVIVPAFKLWWRYITKVLVPVLRFLWNKVVKPVFQLIGGAVKVAWRVVGVALRAWVSYLKRFVFPVLRFLWNKIVRPVFSSLSAFIKRSWENVIRPVFAKLGSFINGTVRPAFKRGVDAIKRIWDGLKAAARAPVEFLVNTVYTKGIRAMMNKIPGVSLPAASFAVGGWTGPGARLQPAGVVHADEFVISKRSRRSLERRHPGLLDAMNNYGKIPGYAGGGTVMPLAGARIGTYPGHDGVDLNVGSGWDDYRMPVRAFRSGGSISYTGWGRGYGLAIFHRGPWGEVVYGHNDSVAVRAGQAVSAGQMIGRVGNTGNSTAPHVHFGYPGGTYSSALALLNGARSVSGSAGPGGQVRVNPGKAERKSILDAVKGIPKLARIAWSGMNSMGSRFGPWGTEFAKGARSAYRSGVNWGDNKIPDKIVVKNFPDVNLPDNPIRAALSKAGLYDNGGWLRPGQIAFNGSNRPEPVFSDAQWSLLRNTAAATPRAAASPAFTEGGRYEMHITDWDRGRGYIERVADSRIVTHQSHRRAVGGTR